MNAFIVLRRGEVVESRHRVHVAVSDPRGRLDGFSGEPDLVTYFRSAAKPFQALPLVADGAADELGISGEELALATGSHSGEPAHVKGVRRLLARAGVPESALELGPELPRQEEVAHELLRSGGRAQPVHNNCSGKHAGMLALARHRGWPLEGYRLPDHPVQRRMLEEVSHWTALEPSGIRPGVDGCGVVCFGVPLAAMARSFAALGEASARGEEAPRRVVEAMVGHPHLVGGSGRLCTELMEAAGGALFAKVGAQGVYCAADVGGKVGIALKVEDGARRAAEVALVRVLELLGLLDPEVREALESYRRPVVPNTRGEAAAFLEAQVELSGGSRPLGRGTERGRTPPDGSGALDPAIRALVRVSGAVATRDPARIRACLLTAEGAAAPEEVEEALVQSYLFVGFPGALNALAVWREMRDGDARRHGQGEAPSDDDEGEWQTRGEAVCRKVYGKRYEALRENIRALHPDLDRWMVREGYGKVLGRPGLELTVRELCVVGLLAVLDAPVQLHAHLRGALEVGAGEEMVEAALRSVEDLVDPKARRSAWREWERVRLRRDPAAGTP